MLVLLRVYTYLCIKYKQMHSCWKLRTDTTFIIQKLLILSFCIKRTTVADTSVIKEDC